MIWASSLECKATLNKLKSKSLALKIFGKAQSDKNRQVVSINEKVYTTREWICNQYFVNLEWFNEILLLADYIKCKLFIFRFPVVMFIREGVLRRFIMIVINDLWFLLFKYLSLTQNYFFNARLPLWWPTNGNDSFMWRIIFETHNWCQH